MPDESFPNSSYSPLNSSDSSEIIYQSSGLGQSFIPYARVSVQGKDISKKDHIKVKITQKMLTYNRYDLLCPSEVFADKNVYPLQNSKYLLGARVLIELIQFGKAASSFEAMVTGVEYVNENQYPFIRLICSAPSILLDQGARSRSFTNLSLKQIVERVASGYNDQRLNFLIAPFSEEVLPYTCQINESDFDFLKRLAVRFGEFFYHNGQSLIFGIQGQRKSVLLEGKDFYKYNLRMNSSYQHFSCRGYDLNQDLVHEFDSQRFSSRNIVNLFQFRSIDSSESIFTHKHTEFFTSDLLVNGKFSMEKVVERKKLSKENLASIETQTDSPFLRLGDIMSMQAWDQEKQKALPIESYRILEIVHVYSAECYYNLPIGMPREHPIAPYFDEKAFPRADSQYGVVVDNNDPWALNRVKVRLVWQRDSQETTPWISMLQAHSGDGQGAHVLPEVGHSVLVDFLSGNAEAPVVVGTVFNGNQKSGFHTPNNDLKSFQTRSGTKRVANDAEGSILEEDSAGSFLKLEGDGNVTLHVVKNLNIRVGENLSVSVGKDMVSRIDGNKSESVIGDSVYSAQNVTATVSENYRGSVGKVFYQSSGSLEVQTLNGELKLSAATLAIVKGLEDVKVSKG
ncbi:hypothetical protein ETU10_06475 [Apibacter muscae]|uniref:phage baseplate assembly protein V n=1 Tax=Apibacter muscae TaxID=2509004 RepID=UPI0011AC256F|nr:phage baseplate assembly protein V [Apibacter muscae]TWP23872.1 hypothetical protein ETU10_06475 [Apibacter muscae]